MKKEPHSNRENVPDKKETIDESYRRTTQNLMPAIHTPTPPGMYDIYPGFDIGPRKITVGFSALAEALASHSYVIIDGYQGILWEDMRERLDSALKKHGITAHWVDVSQAYLSEKIINHNVEPYLGGDDPLFGTQYPGTLVDFFDREHLQRLKPNPDARMNIVYGTGADLIGWKGFLVYVDLPKNELQYRSRAGRVCNLGQCRPQPSKPQYKRCYFVDWVALNRHKAKLLPSIDLFVDGQRPDEPTMAAGTHVREALSLMSENYFRVRPWFEPGPWGGRWILEHIPGLSKNVPNYAWSFELIVPENGLLLESDRLLLEISYDFIMYQNHTNILGYSAERFKYEFPIRFDFLDTFGGGNLSVQCHPRPDYIRENFGETFTQDEAYYILDCKAGSGVFIGFREGLNKEEFKEALEKSFREKEPVDIKRYVNFEKSQKHDLFLIPHGTIHGSGQNNIVLEISSTPYIFTFKMYDWLRMDLDGQPRPLNIDRAFENLFFDRQEHEIKQRHIVKPQIIGQGAGWQLVHLQTHPVHFYDVHRFEFTSSVEARTEGSPHVMNLVEGTTVILETSKGRQHRFNYAETFVVPAAAESYRLISDTRKPVKVVKSFIKKTEGSHY